LTVAAESLLRYAALQQLPGASDQDHHLLCKWLSVPKGGNGFLQQREMDPWSRENFADLISVQKSYNDDTFTNIWRTTVVRWYHYAVGYRFKFSKVRQFQGQAAEANGSQFQTSDSETGIIQYSDTAIATMSRVLGTALAATFPTAAIFTLYFVHSQLARLGIICAFVVTFSIALTVFTRATGTEIFAATSA
jgi:hypothetical protein